MGEGMWIFHEGVSRLRTEYDLIVKIDAHNDRDVSGRREGRVLADQSPLTHPIPLTTPPNVFVKFTDGKQVTRIESLPVNALRTTAKLRNKGQHVIVKGEQVGTLVTHLRTQNGLAKVYAEGTHRLEAFLIQKERLCIVEPKCTSSLNLTKRALTEPIS